MVLRLELLGLIACALVLARPAHADPPLTAAELAKTRRQLSRSCARGDVDGCISLGELEDDEYTVLKSGFHHDRDEAAARRAFGKAIPTLDAQCTAGKAASCRKLAEIYFSSSMDNRARYTSYLERACAAGDGTSCFERGEGNGRSRSSSVPWYAEGCRLGNPTACQNLPMMVVASMMLDPPEKAPMDLQKLSSILEADDPGPRPLDRAAKALALATAKLWAGEKRQALDAFTAAESAAPANQPQLAIFAEYGQLLAADGLDPARVQKAWSALVAHVPKRDGRYKEQELESDYAWADPTPAMERAERIAGRASAR